jgi:hypothetical protein
MQFSSAQANYQPANQRTNGWWYFDRFWEPVRARARANQPKPNTGAWEEEGCLGVHPSRHAISGASM